MKKKKKKEKEFKMSKLILQLNKLKSLFLSFSLTSNKTMNKKKKRQ